MRLLLKERSFGGPWVSIILLVLVYLAILSRLYLPSDYPLLLHRFNPHASIGLSLLQHWQVTIDQ